MRLALIVEYEGTNYHGFQYQTNAPSIQEELEKAIASLTGEQVRVKGAGRTDAGVHAKGQVVAFDTSSTHEPDTFVRALNSYLPDDIAVRAAHKTANGFDPRRHALRRRYMYTVLNTSAPSPLTRRTAYQVREPLNDMMMDEAAGFLVGIHDYVRFSGPLEGRRGGTVRETYEAGVRRTHETVVFDVVASSFLPQQVRRIAGALVDVGRGRLSLDEYSIMVEGALGQAVAHTLPPQGLCLMEVTYSDFPPVVGETHGNKH